MILRQSTKTEDVKTGSEIGVGVKIKRPLSILIRGEDIFITGSKDSKVVRTME
jgi:hypothetical protein